MVLAVDSQRHGDELAIGFVVVVAPCPIVIGVVVVVASVSYGAIKAASIHEVVSCDRPVGMVAGRYVIWKARRDDIRHSER